MATGNSPASAPFGLPGFQVKVASAGARVQFPDFLAQQVTVQAFFKNKGFCVVGGADVVATDSGSNGLVLQAGQSQTWTGKRIAGEQIYVDGDNSSDYVIVSYVPIE